MLIAKTACLGDTYDRFDPIIPMTLLLPKSTKVRFAT